MRMRVLVTGATGNVGRPLVAALLRAGVSPRVLSRRTASLDMPAGVEVVVGDLSDPDSLRAGLDGVDTVYLVWPFSLPVVEDSVLALASGRRVVFQSSSRVRDDAPGRADPGADLHAAIERSIAAVATAWTFLRCGGFATNTRMWAPQIRAGGTVRWPYGAAARSLIHEGDIAAVAARVLLEEGHAGARHVLTGPQSLTQFEQVDAIGRAIGRPLRYQEIPPSVAREEILAMGWPAAFASSSLAYWAQLVSSPEVVSPAVEQITGAPARTFRRWATDHAADFR